MKYLISFFIVILFTASAVAQQDSVFGKWKTIDDETGEAKSIVEIYKKGDKVYGKIIDILNPQDRDKLCIYCEGEEYNKPVLGLDIIKNLERDDDEYTGGTVFDPEKGKTYKAKIWIENDNRDKLYLRGYIAFLYRTQEWIRVK
ncbi:DUF2147 domain-containing protein [uncultured Dokdonia sp.]|uniref:DUF2147 domain-containing protein n=1 Tax=uncultured Dokdonia sp. TaxID=575653 RepID=UPI002633E598|nr:DUF2147 domain-containing protein [uncultured Dokdonia sp.]